MDVSIINRVIHINNNNLSKQPEKNNSEKCFEQKTTGQYAKVSAEQYRSFFGFKIGLNRDPYKAKSFLRKHPASPFIKGKSRENLIKAMENGDVETSNIEMQLALIADKKLPPQTLSYYWETGKMCNQMEADIDMMYDCYTNGKNVDDVYVPNVKTQDEGLKNTKIGDVFKVEGQEMIFVKDKDGSSHQLKMDKETFIKLFPPARRFASIQNKAGDCYLISSLNSAMENPKTRIALYDAFEQDGKDIHVKYPNGQADYVAKDCKLQNETNSETILRGALGMQLLEDAFGLELIEKSENDFRTIMKQKLTEIEAELNAEGISPEGEAYRKDLLNGMKQRLEDFEKAVQNSNNNTIVMRSYESSDKVCYKEDRYGIMFSDLGKLDNKTDKMCRTKNEYYRCNGGFTVGVMNALGIKSKIIEPVILYEDEIKDIFENKPAEEYILTGSSYSTDKLDKEGNDKGIYGNHAYTLAVVRDDDGVQKVRTTNPWNTSRDVDLSIEEFYKYFESIQLFDVDSYEGIKRN